MGLKRLGCQILGFRVWGLGLAAKTLHARWLWLTPAACLQTWSYLRIVAYISGSLVSIANILQFIGGQVSP